LGIALVHQFARLFADRDGGSWVLVRDAGLIERRQKARVAPRTARISLCRRGHPEHGGEAGKHDKESHGFILVQIGAIVSSNFNADESLLIRRRTGPDCSQARRLRQHRGQATAKKPAFLGTVRGNRRSPGGPFQDRHQSATVNAL
jgi:hypothetical protein